MKRKIYSLLIGALLLIILIITTGCSNDENTSANEIQEIETIEEIEETIESGESQIEEDIYLEVLNGTRKYIDEESNETDINEYLQQFNGKGDTKISYAILDMDSNEDLEMIIYFQSYDDFNLILNYDEDSENVYGYEKYLKEMKWVKTDGTYYVSNGATDNAIAKCSFNGSSMTEEIIANIKDTSDEVYVEFEKKENVDYIEYDTYSGGEDTTLEEGTYTYIYTAQTELEGSKVNVTLMNGKATKEETYWGDVYTGTYTLTGNTVVAKYTYHTGFDQGEDQDYEESINITETFNINSDGTLTSQTSGFVFEK